MASEYSGGAPARTARDAASTSGATVSAGATPTARHTAARISTGTFMNRGGSCGVRGRSCGSPLKKTSWMNRAEYATPNAPPASTAPGASAPSRPKPCRSSASAKNISFERKPFSSGTPAIAAAATIASVAVYGMYFHRPLIRRMSRVPHSWSTMPAAMKSEALKVAWLTMWNTAATVDMGESSPIRNVISPSWLMVE